MGTLARSGSVEVEVPASPEQVWALLTDVTRTGEWSHETHRGEWLDGASAAVPGARFRGANQQGRTRWSRVCEVVTVERPQRVSWRTVPTRLYPDSSLWTFDITPTEEGCRIRQSFEVLKLNPVLDRLFYLVLPAHRDRSAALAADVERLGQVAATHRAAEPG
jgi:uncharacterized protein YndB with AHSA1/START domain